MNLFIICHLISYYNTIAYSLKANASLMYLQVTRAASSIIVSSQLNLAESLGNTSKS